MQSFFDQLETVMPASLTGSVVRMEGMMTAVAGFPAPVGAEVEIHRQSGVPVPGEVIGFREDLTLVSPFGSTTGIRRGSRVQLHRTARFLRVGEAMLGRVLDAHGQTLDDLPPPLLEGRVALDRPSPSAVDRPPIDTPLSTGVRAIDGMLTCGRGQRIGIFAGSGVGKSVLLGMMARYTSADVNVIALIGERGREVNEFIQRDLGPEGLARSVIVVATSNEPALKRVHAAMAATAIAEHFRDQGKDVLLLMDSVTRFALAQREIGLAAGEPPTTRGFPPSVFAMLPRLAERAGRTVQGSITGFYSVLVEGDDTNEPISDTVRGILDGHILLSRKIASRGQYPAIDILESISRLAPVVTCTEHARAITAVRRVMAAYREHEDLISIGAYRPGTTPIVDTAIDVNEGVLQFLQQRVDQGTSIESASAELCRLAARCVPASNNSNNKPNQRTSNEGMTQE